MDVHPALMWCRLHRTCPAGEFARSEPLGGAENLSGHPERCVQDNPAGRCPGQATELLREIGHVFEFGAPKRIHGLVGVGCHGQVAPYGGQAVEQARLGNRRVLILVYQHVAILFRDLGSHRQIAEQPHRLGLERAIVDAMVSPEALVIALQEPGQRSPVGPLGGTQCQGLGGQEPLLATHEEIRHLAGKGARGEHRAERSRPGFRWFAGEQLRHQRHLLRSGEDRRQ